MVSTVIIPAGGVGKRFGADIPKQYVELGNKPIIIHTLEVFQRSEFIDNIVISSDPDWKSNIIFLCQKYSIDKLSGIVESGKERQDSIYNALVSEFSANSDIILVHDAVRPFIDDNLIKCCIDTAIRTGTAVPGVKPKNTIKNVQDNKVLRTLNRDRLIEVHTPQVFKADLIKEAFEYARKKGIISTDSSSCVEAIGHSVTIVESSYENIKITSPFDLEIAKLILKTK